MAVQHRGNPPIAIDPHLSPAERDRGGDRPPWSAIADRQFGVITHAQLRASAVSASAIGRLTANGRLRPLHRGVYAVGHSVLVPDGFRLAAVLANGPTARLAGLDAGALHELCRSRGTRFSVAVAHGRSRPGRHPGIHVIESKFTSDDITVVRAIPVTSVARTIVDIAATAPAEVEQMIQLAIDLDLYDQRAMDRQLASGRRGVGVIRRALADRDPDAQATKSKWEKSMLRLVKTGRLPRPKVNVWLPDVNLSPDLLWPAQSLAVEWDSWTHHRTRSTFEDDRRKTIELQSAGYTVLRFTWRQTRDRPEWVTDAIRTALDRSPPESR